MVFFLKILLAHFLGDFTFQPYKWVKEKEKKKIKSEILLDTRIQIKIDVDEIDTVKDNVERGYDDEKKMHFYKVYFNEEL